VIQDFYINATGTGQKCQFAFNLTIGTGNDNATFYDNLTYSSNTTTSFTMDGQYWLNYTDTLPSYNCSVAFELWTSNGSNLFSTTGLRYFKVFTSGDPTYTNNFVSLGQALSTIDAENSWTNVDPYMSYVMNHNQTSLESYIDSLAAAQNWLGVIQWAAICNKFWYGNIPADVQADLQQALPNMTMIEYIDPNSQFWYLPMTQSEAPYPAFSVEDEYALYGYYFNKCSWMGAYEDDAMWNITSAYELFDTAVNMSVANGITGHNLPLYIFVNGAEQLQEQGSQRYYDECASTIECYLIFYFLLNVTDALNKAVYWWNLLFQTHWDPNPGFFKYAANTPEYECEAPFFYEVIGMLKYYVPTLEDWNYFLTDIGNRFLTYEWDSAQWCEPNPNTQAPNSCYVSVHADPGNTQHRLWNTLGDWEALLGMYIIMNSTYQHNLDEMLAGNNSQMAAWQYLLTPDAASQGYGSGAGLFDNTTNQFSTSSADFHYPYSPNNNSTTDGEVLMELLGIVPGTATIALPLEQLEYEYAQVIDPTIENFNVSTHQITIPVVSAGTVTFLYGVSPSTYTFPAAGIYTITFANSWNLISNVTLVSSTLPSNVIYFSHLFPS
jgi:hypothetical protein